MQPRHVLASSGAVVALVAVVFTQAPSPKPSTFAKASTSAQATADRTADKPAGDWASYGGTNWSQKYSALDQIGRSNFNALTVAWAWSSPDHELIKKIPDNTEEP